MGAYDRELVPTTAQQIDRAYPEWALSTARLKIHSAKTLAILDRIADNRDAIGGLLARLEDEGREPCFVEARQAAIERHRAGKALLAKEAFGA